MGSNTCSTCGLPDELCVCEDVARSEQTLEIETEERSYGKIVTIVTGIDDSDVDIDGLASDLKSQFACGGNVTGDGEITLQGDHTGRIGSELEERGYEIR